MFNRSIKPWSNLLSLFHQSTDGLFLKSNIEIVSFFQNQELVDFAVTSFKNAQNEVSAKREMIRNSSESWNSTTAIIKVKNNLFSSEFKFTNFEDPRIFQFRENVYVYMQKFISEKNDIQIIVFNPINETSIELSSPLGFNGKNWVPFEYSNNLYFLYSLEPLVRMKYIDGVLAIDTVPPKYFQPKWNHDPINSIGWIRGGSPLIEIDGRLFGLSHSIIQDGGIHDHRMGIYLYDFEKNEIYHRFLSSYIPGLLVDPYGLTELKNQGIFELHLSIALGDIHEKKSSILNLKIDMNKSSLIDLFTHDRMTP